MFWTPTYQVYNEEIIKGFEYKWPLSILTDFQDQMYVWNLKFKQQILKLLKNVLSY
jgi:hypothetical protein